MEIRTYRSDVEIKRKLCNLSGTEADPSPVPGYSFRFIDAKGGIGCAVEVSGKILILEKDPKLPVITEQIVKDFLGIEL